ncbi:hypothetical protein GE09DRAFT_1230324 [Coniochaeta sp. 2T2.1]|nr:hypothetical protein GE09DRAFT_1230324 [Coniochaeta sp. 2T2.1]
MSTPKPFRGVVSPRTKRFPLEAALLTSGLKDLMGLPGLLCVGAVLQASLLLVLPTRWAVLPAYGFALYGILSTAIQVFFPSTSQFDKDVIRGRVAGALPNKSYDPSRPDEKPLFGPTPAAEQIVCFHLGLRYSHPLGMFAPGAAEMHRHIATMYASLRQESEKYGCLGSTFWRTGGRESKNAGMAVFYFRSVEGLHAFAHDEAHRAGWDWFNGWLKKTGHTHLGIFHETFAAPAGQWETIYGDMPPTLLGAANNVKVLNEQTGEEEYVVPLVDYKHSQLRSKYGRMGWTDGKYHLDGDRGVKA